MGSSQSKSSKTLSVATLNYSGILNSPFQFFSEQMHKEEQKISKIFQRNLKAHIEGYSRESFKWGLGKIDQKMQKERYAAIYDPNVGIVGGKLLNKQQFMRQWDKKFEANIKQIKNLECNEKQRENARKFDYLSYKSIVEYVYNIKQLQKQEPAKLDPQKYRQTMAKFFSKAFLNEQKKIKKTKQAMKQQQIDVFFFQESNKEFIEAIDRNLFQVISQEKKQSVIAIKKSSFQGQKFYSSQEIFELLSHDFTKSLNWNNDTVFAFVGIYIFISGHLSSKVDKNSEQVLEMEKSLSQLSKLFPERCIVVGADVNSYLTEPPEGLFAYPSKMSEHTTIKTRTFVQPQVNKAQVNASSCRDHLITNGILSDEHVQTISKKNWKDISYLPCEQHPYDHFVVTAKILFKKND